jgi:hypothetical protein
MINLAQFARKCTTFARKCNLASFLKLLRDKRSSAVIDVQNIEAQLARLTESAEACGIKTNLRSVAKLYREYIATLDEFIQGAN